VLLSKTNQLALLLSAALAFGIPGFAQPPAEQAKPADAPKKVAKDQAEADLINGLAKEKDPKKQLEALQKWQHDYPDTAFADERRQAFLVAYAQLQDCRNASKAARDVLAVHADNDLALRILASCIYSIKDATQDEYDAAQKTATYLVDHPKSKDNPMTDAQWADFVILCKNVMPFIDMAKKDNEKAEADLRALLTSTPNDAQASYWLGQVLFEQREKKPENQPPAIFEYARAGQYAGPGQVQKPLQNDANMRAQRYYKAYHGSDEGWDKVVALAKTNALPPAGFHIDSTADIAIAQQKAQEAADAADPVFAIYRTVKTGLTADGDAAFFDSNVKDSGLPSPDGSKKFKGTLVSQKPALNPKTLVINYKDPAGDIILELPTPLRGKMEPGAVQQKPAAGGGS